MSKEMSPICPECGSQSVVKNGFPHGGKNWGGKQQFKCKNCSKYFFDNSLKEYPKTNLPFPVMAQLLYYYKKSPTYHNNMRKFRKQVIVRLHCLGQIREDEKVPRQTIHYWIENYLDELEKIISFKDTCEYCAPLDILYKIGQSKKYTDSDYPSKKHMDILRMFCKLYGKNYCMKLLKKNPRFFDSYSEYPIEISK